MNWEEKLASSRSNVTQTTVDTMVDCIQIFFADRKGLIIENLVQDADAENRAQNITRQRRRALILHLAGPEVQDIFRYLSGAIEYALCVKALNNYFVPPVNMPYARQLFNAAEPNIKETFQQFSTRLHRLAMDCNMEQTWKITSVTLCCGDVSLRR